MDNSEWDEKDGSEEGRDFGWFFLTDLLTLATDEEEEVDLEEEEEEEEEEEQIEESSEGMEMSVRSHEARLYEKE
jgi:hypothetical protein